MSVDKLPSGRWRAQVHDVRVGHNVPVSRVLGPAFKSFATKREAKAARELARQRIEAEAPEGLKIPTVRAWRDRWLTDPLFMGHKKESTLKTAHYALKGFVAKYGELRLDQISDLEVARHLASGKASYTVPVLKAMFNDACSPEAGRLIRNNPFACLRLSKGKGRAVEQPPSEEMVWKLIGRARQISGQGFAAWLQVAAHEGMRPGEVDYLAWRDVDLGTGWIYVRQQFNAATRKPSGPKHGSVRKVPLTPHARSALEVLPQESEFCFLNLHGKHWTPSSRAYHWKAVKEAAGYGQTLYLATRHYAGWYMTNILLLPPEDVAIFLGHKDGGALVRSVYGHRDENLALERVREAYERAGIKPLRLAQGA